MSDESTVKVSFEDTPNPQSLKFKVNKFITDQIFDFKDASSAQGSPLAAKLFGFPWTEAVFVGEDFITITKQDWVDWETLASPLAELIAEHLQKGLGVTPQELETSSDDIDTEGDPVIRLIKQVLYNEIRPAVALDGGDVSFHSFANNTVYIYMRGACSGCPSSSYTLKMGIETRLREAVPEVHEVIAL